MSHKKLKQLEEQEALKKRLIEEAHARLKLKAQFKDNILKRLSGVKDRDIFSSFEKIDKKLQELEDTIAGLQNLTASTAEELNRKIEAINEDTSIEYELGKISNKIKEIKIPEAIDIKGLKQEIEDGFQKYFERNINILGMPDFRKLAMGLQAQIDDLSGGGDGDVTGPASSTNNEVVRFDGTTGKTIQSGGITIADGASGILSGTNTGDQTSIVGITGTTAEFNTALSDANFATGGGTATGTNTGDQTITLTTDVTGSGTGSFAATIANDAVTYAKMQNISATDKVLGRSTAGAGDTEEIACTAAGRALLDDVNAAAQIVTLGITSTAAELNILDGATLDVTELNYVDGVTSAIQTQIDAKAPTASPTFTGTVTMPVGLTGVLRADTGVVAVDSDVTDIVTAASLTAAGKVELATTAEINTGTDSTRAMPADQFVASNRNVRYILFRVIAKATDWDADGTTAVGGDLVIPFTGTITDIEADVDTAGTTGTAIVDVNLGGTTIMTTDKLKWDSTEKSTRTFSGNAPGLTTTAVTAGNIITVDIDTNHTTKSKGLTLFLAIRLT